MGGYSTILTIVAVLAVFAAVYFFAFADHEGSREAPSNIEGTTQSGEEVEVVATGLEVPWEVEFLPNGDMLVTERTGYLYVFSEEEGRVPVEGVESVGEGGLLGLALDPDFEENNYVYLYQTTSVDGGLSNRVVRYVLAEGPELRDPQVIIDSIPGAQYHDGGRIAFGPDDLLYITTGDAGESSLAQDTNSLAGKILRIHRDGSVPEGNPFGNEVYSYGHRNPQGITWDDEGRLWSTEHGRSGIRSGFDELNLIEAGGNYGWPVIQGDQTQEGMIAPVLHSGANTTWAPASAVFYDGSVFFGGLRGETLYEAVLAGAEVEELREHVSGEYGRLRTATLGPEGALYVTTSNRDGRGSVREGDDKIIRFSLPIGTGQ